MVALAVVAIVSTSLLQMFVTTSHVNRDAQLTDLANIIAVRQAEAFKADPEHYNIYYSGTEYYDSLGKAPLPARQSGIPTGAVIQVDSAVTSNPSVNSPGTTGYFPSFAGTIDLTPYTDQGADVQITSTKNVITNEITNEISYGPHGGGGQWQSLTYLQNFIMQNNILPIQVEFTSGSQPSRTIYILNNSSVEVNLYFFTPDSNNPAQNITLIPVSGYSSITNVLLNSSTNTTYKLALTVSKLVGNVSQFMFTYSADRYVYH